MLQEGIADGVSRREAAKYRRYDGQGRRILRPMALQRFSKVLIFSNADPSCPFVVSYHRSLERGCTVVNPDLLE